MSVYPGAIPSSGDLPDAGANLSSNPHSSLHDDVRDEVIAIATELGVEPSGTEATVRARLDAGLGLREIVTFTADGTFTKASYPWLRAVRVRVQGSGGGGAGAAATGAGQASTGAGGAAGGYAESFILAENLDDDVSVTVPGGGSGGTTAGGAGTTSLFGSISATGGAGGSHTTALTVFPLMETPAAGGMGTGGDINIAGQPGQANFQGGAGGNQHVGGSGGGSVLGGGGRAGRNSAGAIGRGFGSGGGGGGNSANRSAQTGGAGAPGVVIVELYA